RTQGLLPILLVDVVAALEVSALRSGIGEFDRSAVEIPLDGQIPGLQILRSRLRGLLPVGGGDAAHAATGGGKRIGGGDQGGVGRTDGGGLVDGKRERIVVLVHPVDRAASV